MRPPTLAAIALLLLPIHAAAQAPFDPRIGNPLGMGDDTMARSLQLGFSFTFPDGVATSAIDVDSNGRILRPVGASSQWNQSVFELLGGPSSLCPFWTDIDPASSDDVYFNALPGVTLVTWQDVELYGGSPAFTFQCQLRADGRVAFVYDDRTPATGALVGLSAGGGAANPGSVDFSISPAASAGPTIYESFAAFDLQSSSLGFARGGAGWTATLGPSGFPVRASVAPHGRACPRTLELTPLPGGGYAVSQGAAVVTPFGADLGPSGDDVVGGPFALGFAFPMPGGTTVTAISIDTNGRILPPGSDTSDPTPTIAELLGEGHATIAPLWADLDTTPTGGSVRLATTATSATVTWTDIAQHGTAHGMTVQATLRVDGSMSFTYLDVTDFDAGLGDAIVGLSPGGGAGDPGELDWTSGDFATGGTAYERFRGAVDPVDLQLLARAVSRPQHGGVFEVGLLGVPAGSAAGLLLIGLNPVDVPLDAIGFAGCSLLVAPAPLTVTLPVFGSESSSFGLGIPADPSLNGNPVVVQGLTITPGAGPIPFVFGNAVVGTVGN